MNWSVSIQTIFVDLEPFRDPAMEQLEYNVIAEGTSYQFTIKPNNESLVSCTIDNFEESDQIMVAGM